MYIYVYICINEWTGRKENNKENILAGSWTRVDFTRVPKLSKQQDLARRMYSSNLFINGVLLFRKRNPTTIACAQKK